MKIPKLRLFLLIFLPSVFSCFVITACTSEQPKPTPEPTATPSPTYTSNPNRDSNSEQSTVTVTPTPTPTITPTQELLESPNQDNSPIVQAKTIYRCESYTRVDGTSAYRVNPSIADSFGSSNPREFYRQCFVPVTEKQCTYKDTSNDNEWYKCGDTGVRPGEFDFRKGIGEIEDNNGKKYHAFNSVVQFTFE